MSQQQQQELKKFFYNINARLVIAELKSARSLEQKGWFETENGITFDAIETIGLVTKVSASEDKNYFIINDMKEETLMVSAGGDFTEEYIKRQASTVPVNSLVLVRGKLSVYTRDGETKCSVNPKEIVVIGDDMNFRQWWYFTVLRTRIENTNGILVNSDLYNIVESLNLKTRKVNDSTITVEATIEKILPKQVVVKDEKKKEEPAPSRSVSTPSVTKVKESPTTKVESTPTPVKTKKIAKVVDQAEKEKIKTRIVEYVKKKGNPALDAVKAEMKDIDDKTMEECLVELVSKRQIKMDDNDRLKI